MVARASTARQASKEMCSPPSPLGADTETLKQDNSKALTRL